MKKIVALAIATTGLALMFGANYLGYFKPSAESLIGTQLESTKLVDLKGVTRSVSEFKGQPTTVYFWASWCNPCVVTLKEIAQGSKAAPSENFVAIAMDSDQALVKKLVQRTGFKGNVLIATEGTMLIQQKYAGNDKRAIPYVVQLNAAGEIIDRRYGL